jgi:uncharacterized integral membrane protein
MPKNLHTWISAGITALVVILIVQNLATVEVTFLFWAIALPRALLLFLVFVVGVLVGWIVKSAKDRRAIG